MAESWCRICGKQYKVCSHCETMRNRTPWRIIADTATHYQIWVIIQQYKKGIINRETARQMFSQVSITEEEIQGFIPAVQEIIKEINSFSNTEEAKAEVIQPNNETASVSKKRARRRGRTS